MFKAPLKPNDCLTSYTGVKDRTTVS